MEIGLVTADGTKVLTVEEYDRFINSITGLLLNNHQFAKINKELKTLF